LFYNADFKDNDISFNFSKQNRPTPTFKIKINTVSSKPVSIAIRKPDWAKNLTIKLNDITLESKEKAGYLVITRNWKADEELSINFEYVLQFIAKDITPIRLSGLKGNVSNAAMLYGPYLLSVDDGFMSSFLAEPATDNVINIDIANIGVLKSNSKDEIVKKSLLLDAYLTFKYKHEGFYGENNVTMRPVSEISHQRLANVKFWFRFNFD